MSRRRRERPGESLPGSGRRGARRGLGGAGPTPAPGPPVRGAARGPRRIPSAARRWEKQSASWNSPALSTSPGGRGCELEKVGPARPLAPGARRARAPGTDTAEPKRPPPQRCHPEHRRAYGDGARPTPGVPCRGRVPRRGRDGAGQAIPGPWGEGPRRCPSEPPTCGAVPPARRPRCSPAGSGVGERAGLSPRECDRAGPAGQGQGQMSASGRGGGGRTSQTPAVSRHPAPPTPRQPAREGPGQPPAPAPLPRPGDRTGLPAPRARSPR